MGVASLVHHKNDKYHKRKDCDGQRADKATDGRTNEPQERLDEQGEHRGHDTRANVDHREHLDPREEAER